MKPYYQDSAVCIYHGDCREVLPRLPEPDLVLTDPPYNASFNQDGSKKRGVVCKRKGYRALSEAWDDRIGLDIVVHFDCDVLACCSFHLLNDYMTAKRPYQILHWHKPNAFPALGDYYTFSIEYILWWRNGGIFNRDGAGMDMISLPICGGHERTEHPTQKPIGLFLKLVRNHSLCTQTILDPFMGSGSTLRAAKDLGRKAVGIEIEERYCEIAARRMEQEVLPFEQPPIVPIQDELLV